MNWQAFFDAALAVVALWVAWQPAQHKPSLRLAALIIASAAILGTLRFSGLLPLPGLHQFVSMLGAGVALPLLAVTFASPGRAIVTERRYAWIFAVIAAVLCTLLVMLAQFKLWSALCAALSALAIVAAGLGSKQPLVWVAGLLLLLAFAAFAAKLEMAGLLPGDMLHIGMALGLLLLGRRAQRA
jgi:hypothetical protein